ncbi:MAG: single-stranded DNA-binding protein [Acidimicrobiales bacterium]
MSNGNHVTITGNITRDPELRFTGTGQAIAQFGVAVNRRWQNRQTNEWEEATSFIDVVAWGTLGENCAQSLSRGSRVVVTGRLDQRSWEGQDGTKHSKIEINADEVAPSLRYATAMIAKNDRHGPDGSPATGGQGASGYSNQGASGYSGYSNQGGGYSSGGASQGAGGQGGGYSSGGASQGAGGQGGGYSSGGTSGGGGYSGPPSAGDQDEEPF